MPQPVARAVTDVAVFSFGRTGSQRCPNKMLRPMAGTTLTDIFLAKLARCPYPTFFAGYEPEFRARCEAHGVRFVQRDQRSATIDEPIVDILSFLRPLDFTHFLCVNASLPFLAVETVTSFLDDCLAHDREPAFGVIRRLTHFMSLDRRALNFDGSARTINTKTVEPVLEFAHALYFFSKDYFFREGRYWDWSTVRLIEIPDKLQVVDVDTEEDFRIAEALWTGFHPHPRP
jgi:CMP-N-acetylneuraminic acid synthetase